MIRLRKGLHSARCAFVLAALAAWVAACSAQQSKVTPAGPAPTTIEEALGQLEAAEGDIERLLAMGPAGQPAYAQPPGYPPGQATVPAPERREEPAPPPPPTQPSPARAETYGGTSPRDAERSPAQLSASDPCLNACRALASMERAAQHLCALAGGEDARCTSAMTRLRGASERVHAGCPRC
jgi:hypothetical protein